MFAIIAADGSLSTVVSVAATYVNRTLISCISPELAPATYRIWVMDGALASVGSVNVTLQGANIFS